LREDNDRASLLLGVNLGSVLTLESTNSIKKKPIAKKTQKDTDFLAMNSMLRRE